MVYDNKKFLEKRQRAQFDPRPRPAFLGLMYFMKMLLCRIELRKLKKPKNDLKHLFKEISTVNSFV